MSLLGIVNRFKHKAEIRESQDEILLGEMIYLFSLQGWPCMGFDQQHVRFRTLNDVVLYSLHVRLDRKTIIIKAEVKSLLADPDDLVQQWSTDIRKILKLPASGQIKVSHELNSNFAEKAVAIDVDQYVLQGERGRGALNTLLVGTTNELREVLKPYRR